MNDKDLEKDIHKEEKFTDKTREKLPTQEQNVTEKKEEELARDNVTEKKEEELARDNVTEKKEEELARDNVTEKKEEELARLKDDYLRLMAEYDNYRKRTLKEKADLIRNGGEKVFIELLPVIDDFERALKTIEETKETDTIKEGINLIYRKFLSFLQRNGIKAIDSVGKTFEADLFEAVTTVPAENEDQKGKIIDDLQTGYILNDKVIRHAKVVVAN